MDTERLAERETLLHRLGSKLNRTVLNSCGNSLSVAEKHVTFPQPGFFANRVFFTKFTIFGNTKQVIQDYDTVFDNSIPFRKNDPLRITYFRIPGVPGLHLCLGTGRRLWSHSISQWPEIIEIDLDFWVAFRNTSDKRQNWNRSY